jgi:hypothetical protein
MEEDLHKRYTNEIYGKENDIKENDNKEGKLSSLMGISLGYMNKDYKFNRVENIVNIDIQKYFLKHYQYSKYENFEHFIQLFSNYLVLHSFNEFLRINNEIFCKLLYNENIKAFFKIKIVKDDLNVLVLDKAYDNSKKENVLDNELIKNKPITSLTQNEKLILLHIMFNYFIDKIKEIPPTEYFRILALCSDIIEEKDFYRISNNNTKYRYFSLGVNASEKKFSGDKRIMIENIIKKIEKLPKISKFVKALTDYKFNEF